MSLFEELKRRNVIRVGAAYLVIGWLLLQVADILTPALHLPEWIASAIALVLILGIVPVLLFSWAYELTPEGLKKDSEVDKATSGTSHTAKKLDVVTLVAVAGVAALIGWQQFNRPADSNDTPAASSGWENAAQPSSGTVGQEMESGIPDKSIAVLPFANRSPKPEDAFFTDGVHDDLLTHLSKIGDLHVISRTSVMGFAGTEQKIPDIARELGVATIMEGAVQRAGNRVRINVQLIDGTTDQHLWAEIYDRELTVDNVFDIQSEITLAIAAALKAVLTPADQATIAERPTQSLAAYDAFLRGMALLRGEANSFNARQVEQAPAAFDEAIAADPDFGIAYAGKARALMYDLWVNSRIDKSVVSEARSNLDRARVLAPNNVETLIAEGYYYYYGFLDFERALQFIERAIAAAPNDSQAWKLKMFVTRRMGRFQEAELAFDKAFSLDPLSTPYVFYYARDLAIFGRFEEAVGLMTRIRTIDGSLEQGVAGEAFVWMARGNPQRACEVLDSVKPKADWDQYFALRARCIAALPDDGGRDRIDEALAAIPDDFFEYPGYPEAAEFFRAFALEATGRKDEARALAREIAQRIGASGNAYPRGWVQPPYLPVDLPGLLGDLDGVRAAARDYEDNAAPDMSDDFDRHMSIAGAFARAGDPDTAFDYVDRVIKVAGPSRYLAVSIDSAFDDARDHPRYLALKADYEAWATNPG